MFLALGFFFCADRRLLVELPLTLGIGGDTIVFEGIENPVDLLFILDLLLLRRILRVDDVQNGFVTVFIFQVFFVRLTAAALFFSSFLLFLFLFLSLPLLDLARKRFKLDMGSSLLSDLFRSVLTVPLFIASLCEGLVSAWIRWESGRADYQVMFDKSRSNSFVQRHFTLRLGGSALSLVDLLDVLFDALELAHNGVFSGIDAIESQVCC